MPVFKRIVRSERKHMQAVENLIARYGLSNPVKEKKSGTFGSSEMKKLYNKLTAEGAKSKVDALRVALTIEDLDIYDLEGYIKHTKNAMIKRVYENLMRGSRNHMRMFYRILKRVKGTYKPQYISKALFDKIISTPMERGKNRG